MSEKTDLSDELLLNAFQEFSEEYNVTRQDVFDILNETYSIAPKFNTLSDRETQVAILTARGVSIGDTAEQLGISINTVKTYRKLILHKLGAPPRTCLCCFLQRTLNMLSIFHSNLRSSDSNE